MFAELARLVAEPERLLVVLARLREPWADVRTAVVAALRRSENPAETFAAAWADLED